MKTLFLSLAFIVLSCILMAQTSERRGYIGLSMGPAFPLVDAYTSAPIDVVARTGTTLIVVNFGYCIGRNYGITGSSMGVKFRVDVGDSFIKVTYGGLMGGPFFTYALSERIDFDVKAMIGLVSTKLCLNDAQGKTTSGLGYAFGTGIRYSFAKKWCILLYGDYFAGNPLDSEERINMASIAIIAGVAYRLK